MTIADLQKDYWDNLGEVYGEREAKAITRIVFEKILELDSHKLSLERFRILTSHQQEQLNKVLERLLEEEPVQYVLGEADFYGFKFKVNKYVLIPRPETEELVDWVIQSLTGHYSSLAILDIGTGSGCIPISIAKRVPGADIGAIDISENALEVARENSTANGTKVVFKKMDILSEKLPSNSYDIIISNPPYIAPSEKNKLANNVFMFEPHLALFAPENDSLLFYRKISEQAFFSLKPTAKLFFEINEAKGEEVVLIMKEAGFRNIELRKDINGKERMIRGEK